MLLLDLSLPDPCTALVALRGELDLAGTAHVRTLLGGYLDGGRDVVVHAREVSFVDCAGLAAVVWAARHAPAAGRRLVVAECSPPVTRLLALTGRDAVLDRHDTLPQALTALGRDRAPRAATC